MKKLFLVLNLFVVTIGYAQTKNFRFAFISDTHIGSPNGSAEEDLRRTVADINSLQGVDFVVLTGDITELGSNRELSMAKQILDSLQIKYYIIPGNHDTGWSESGGLSYSKTFGYDKFHFVHNGMHFIGCPSGPYVRMSDGHVPRDAMNWMKAELKKIKKDEPVVFLNHYPLDPGLDNWYEVIDMLKAKNTVLALCGHGHNNRDVQAEDIPAVMGRSNLRAKEAEGGYNLVDVTADSFYFTVRRPVSKRERKWKSVVNEKQNYATGKKYPRPDFTINKKYPQVKAAWTYQSDANVISTPVVAKGMVIFGNHAGLLEAVDLKSGKRRWKYQLGGPVFSSPAFDGNNRIILGSTDNNIYCFDLQGKLVWKTAGSYSILGSPLIEGSVVYIGGGDGNFYALDIRNGKTIWNYKAGGAVVSKPVVHGNNLIFGAWDTYLHAVDKRNGSSLWKWTNGSKVINFSPASVIPVIRDSVVYVAAPDRYLSAIHLADGRTLWRTNQATVRESIGISEDGSLVYGKTMQDTVVAYHTNPEAPSIAWKMHAGYGYEHTPSMLIEKNGNVFFGTRSGVVYAIDPGTQAVTWAYKIDNSMVNTVNVLDNRKIIASTMDGKVVLLNF